jgi:hypothetical protein
MDEARLGTILFLIHCTLQTAQMYLIKAIFEQNEGISVWQVTFARSIFSILFILTVLNVNIKKEVYDSLNKDNVGILAFRSMQGCVTIMMSYYVINYFNVAVVGIGSSM